MYLLLTYKCSLSAAGDFNHQIIYLRIGLRTPFSPSKTVNDARNMLIAPASSINYQLSIIKKAFIALFGLALSATCSLNRENLHQRHRA